MSKTLDQLKARTTRLVYLLEGERGVDVLEAPAEGALPFRIRRVSVRDVAIDALRHVLSEDQRLLYGAKFMRAGGEALSAAMPDTPGFQDTLSPEDQAELDRLNVIASRMSTAAVLHAGMVEPTYEDAYDLIAGGPYELALYRALISYSGVVRDPK